MAKTKHTPGPWTAERGNAGADHPLFVVAPDKDGFRPWCDADARLIAAAPELLELAELGYGLSRWAASISWDSRDTNTEEWLADLREQIDRYQEAYGVATAKAEGVSDAN